MNVFLDANVFLDVMLNRMPFAGDSEKVINMCSRGIVKGFYSALTACNLAYVLRKYCSSETARNCINSLSTFIEMVDVKAMSVKTALAS